MEEPLVEQPVPNDTEAVCTETLMEINHSVEHKTTDEVIKVKTSSEVHKKIEDDVKELRVHMNDIDNSIHTAEQDRKREQARRFKQRRDKKRAELNTLLVDISEHINVMRINSANITTRTKYFGLCVIILSAVTGLASLFGAADPHVWNMTVYTGNKPINIMMVIFGVSSLILSTVETVNQLFNPVSKVKDLTSAQKDGVHIRHVLQNALSKLSNIEFIAPGMNFNVISQEGNREIAEVYENIQNIVQLSDAVKATPKLHEMKLKLQQYKKDYMTASKEIQTGPNNV